MFETNIMTRKFLLFTLRDDIPIIRESWLEPKYRSFADTRKQASSLTYNAFLTYVMWMRPMPGEDRTKNKNSHDICTYLLQVQRKVRNPELKLSQIYNFGANYNNQLKTELVNNHGYTYEYLDNIYVSILYDLFIEFLAKVMVIISNKTLNRNIQKIKRGEVRDPSQEQFTKEDIIPLLNDSKITYDKIIVELSK